MSGTVLVRIFNRLTGKSVPLEGTNGAAHVTDGDFATKITTAGGYTYIAKALLPGTTYANRAAHEAAAVWQAKRIDANGSAQYADGNSNYDNVATDLTALTYL